MRNLGSDIMRDILELNPVIKPVIKPIAKTPTMRDTKE